MKKVLIIRTGAIGDVVETTGLVDALVKEGCSVDYLTGKIPAMLLENNPHINNVFVLNKKNYSYVIKLAMKFKKEKYDIILNLQPSIRFKILSALSFPNKIYEYKKSQKYHAVENFFETGKRAIKELSLDKNIHLYIPEELINEKRALLDENKIHICFNTGASGARKGRKWCIEYWQKLAKMIFDNYNAQIYVVGSQEDFENAKDLFKKFPQIKSFAGKTTIVETAALLANADIVISGDTGPLHIASALNTICIGLYGSCPVKRSGPYGEKHFTIASDVSCSPCNRKTCKYSDNPTDDTLCMREIMPEKVFNLVDTILKK